MSKGERLIVPIRIPEGTPEIPLLEQLVEDATNRFQGRKTFVNKDCKKAPYSLTQAVQDSLACVSKDPYQIFAALVIGAHPQRDPMNIIETIDSQADGHKSDGVDIGNGRKTIDDVNQALLYDEITERYPEFLDEAERQSSF